MQCLMISLTFSEFRVNSLCLEQRCWLLRRLRGTCRLLSLHSGKRSSINDVTDLKWDFLGPNFTCPRIFDSFCAAKDKCGCLWFVNYLTHQGVPVWYPREGVIIKCPLKELFQNVVTIILMSQMGISEIVGNVIIVIIQSR